MAHKRSTQNSNSRAKEAFMVAQKGNSGGISDGEAVSSKGQPTRHCLILGQPGRLLIAPQAFT